MNEITYPTMKQLDQLLPIDALFLYCASNLGEFTVDKTNKTITFNQTYNFDTNMISEWEIFLANARSEYDANLESGQTIAPNDEILFSQIENWIQISKQLFDIT